MEVVGISGDAVFFVYSGWILLLMQTNQFKLINQSNVGHVTSHIPEDVFFLGTTGD